MYHKNRDCARPIQDYNRYMALVILLKEYLFWHYGRAFKDLAGLAKNFFWFGRHFFSLKLLATTLFSPFYRMREDYGRGLNLENLAENLVANVVSRVVGLIFRTIVVFTGIIFETVLGVLVILTFILWPLLPVAVALLFLSGAALLL